MAQSQKTESKKNGVSYPTYNELFSQMQKISNRYGDSLSLNGIASAFNRTGIMDSMFTPNPYVQNKRVKHISSAPVNYDKNKVTEMIQNPLSNERPLREEEHLLEYTAYPLYHTRTVYQNLLTYHWFIEPSMAEEADTAKKDFWREYKLLYKVANAMGLKAFAHKVTGQALQEGKVFYHPRVLTDKVHNKVLHGFLQQLPSDWCKIVGFNNKSKYTVAFDMMYFTKSGTDVRQFGHLFDRYMDEFYESLSPAPKGTGTRVVYAKDCKVNLKNIKTNDGSVDAYYQSGKWYYWVVLPIDEVFTFEIDDTNLAAISPFTGMFLDLIQLSQMEAIQLELIQNPLISVLTGEIPYYDTKDTDTSDQYMLSPSGRTLFESYWYTMMRDNNTSGIGWYAAPLKNMTLHSLAESPSAMSIVSTGYEDMMSKTGLTALIPVGSDARAGAVNVSFQIESQYPKTIYGCVERMMDCIFEKLHCKYEWKFGMFGDLQSDKQLEDSCRQAMTLGILPATIIYNALHDRSLLDDMCLSSLVINSDIISKRVPLQSTYNMTESGDAQSIGEPNVGGRPKADITEVGTDGGEADIDSMGE